MKPPKPNELLTRLTRIEKLLNQILKQGATIMALDATLLKRLDDATNAIAARLQSLLDSQKNNMTPEQVQALTADIGRLETMGKDAASPIPA